MPEALSEIADRLYTAKPHKNELLFHYTSLSSFLSIVNERTLWASDVRYLNDEAELRHFADALILQLKTLARSDAMAALIAWLRDGFLRESSVFMVSFTVQGDLLSQWRAYCAPRKGVSLGFQPDAIATGAPSQGFQVGRCIYEREEQSDVVSDVLDALKTWAVSHDTSGEPFADIAGPLLRIAALFKSPAFREEFEWRAVRIPNSMLAAESRVEFREGVSTLVPYVVFDLSRSAAGPLDTVFVGPTPHQGLASQAILHYLQRHREFIAHKEPTVFPSTVPYRTW